MENVSDNKVIFFTIKSVIVFILFLCLLQISK